MLRACTACGKPCATGHCAQHPPSSKVTSHRRHRKRRAQLMQQSMTCHICHEPINPKDFHADHYKSLARGGPDTLANLKPSHAWCNKKKGDS